MKVTEISTYNVSAIAEHAQLVKTFESDTIPTFCSSIDKSYADER